mmetsp:Transcript_73311/g.171832  ORF Transcript_73311/g.171832 Transcript_73311/m.171832 type:complete len:225 (+) Transcript_73311:186-860(+)
MSFSSFHSSQPVHSRNSCILCNLRSDPSCQSQYTDQCLCRLVRRECNSNKDMCKLCQWLAGNAMSDRYWRKGHLYSEDCGRPLLLVFCKLEISPPCTVVEQFRRAISAQHLEVAALLPFHAKGIQQQPVIPAVHVCSPTNQSGAMPAERISMLVLVNSALRPGCTVEEVLIEEQCHIERTICDQLLHHVSFQLRHRVALHGPQNLEIAWKPRFWAGCWQKVTCD